MEDRWTLRAADRALLGNKTGATRLGFAVLLKLFAAEGGVRGDAVMGRHQDQLLTSGAGLFRVVA